MSAPVRLAGFLAALILVFGASFLIAGAVVPDRVVDDWMQSAQDTPPHDAATESPAHSGATDAPVNDGNTEPHAHAGGGR